MTARRRPPTERATSQPIRAQAHRVLVPRQPDRLRPLDVPASENRDEIDLLVDEVFGEPIEDAPGKFDLALLVVGGLLVTWSLLTGQSAGVTLIGALVILLGLALPLRAARRKLRGDRASREQRRLLGHGLVLDTSHAAVRGLVQAYAALADAAELPGVRQGAQALEAGHLALSEVASLLNGRPPLVDGEIDYIRRRTTAVDALAAELRRAHEVTLEAREAQLAEEAEPLRLRAAALATARAELDTLNPADSLDELERLTVQIRRASP